MVARAHNYGTQELEAEGLWVQSQIWTQQDPVSRKQLSYLEY